MKKYNTADRSIKTVLVQSAVIIVLKSIRKFTLQTVQYLNEQRGHKTMARKILEEGEVVTVSAYIGNCATCPWLRRLTFW